MYEFSVKAGRQADWDDPNWSMLDHGPHGRGARYFLGIAVGKNDLKLAEWLLARGASPNASPPPHPKASKRTLYEEAMRNGFTEMADLLARYGATPLALVPHDETCEKCGRMMALKRGRYGQFLACTGYPECKNTRKPTKTGVAAAPVALEGIEAFVTACFRLDRAEAQKILTEHPEFLQSPEPIFAAARRDRADVVEFLLDLGVSIEVEDESKQRPLHEAASNDSLRVAQLLIERGAEIEPVETSWNNTPLDHAMYSNLTRMIEFLSRFTRDVFRLTRIGNIERLRDVLREEPDLAKVVDDGYTPLMWLPDDEARAVEIVELLLAHGADPTLRSKEGMTAADWAIKRGLYEAAALLGSIEEGS
jgi:ankyrin repeat protein